MASNTALGTLNSINGTLQLGLMIGGQIVPIFVGIIKDVKAILNENGEIEYTVALTQGQAELVTAVGDFTSVIDLVNSERAKVGLPPFVVPGK